MQNKTSRPIAGIDTAKAEQSIYFLKGVIRYAQSHEITDEFAKAIGLTRKKIIAALEIIDDAVAKFQEQYAEDLRLASEVRSKQRMLVSKSQPWKIRGERFLSAFVEVLGGGPFPDIRHRSRFIADTLQKLGCTVDIRSINKQWLRGGETLQRDFERLIVPALKKMGISYEQIDALRTLTRTETHRNGES